MHHDRGSVLPLAALLIAVTSLLVMGIMQMATTVVHRQHAQTAADALVLAIAQQRETTDVVTSYDIAQYSVTSQDNVVSVRVICRGIEASATANIHQYPSSLILVHLTQFNE